MGPGWTAGSCPCHTAAPNQVNCSSPVYQPTSKYQNAPKREGIGSLTPARALIAELIRRYSVLGLECSNLAIHKLAWFLHCTIQRLSLPDPLDLRFGANRYGPHAAATIDGFESPYGMELLATVDWLLSEQGAEPTVKGTRLPALARPEELPTARVYRAERVVGATQFERAQRQPPTCRSHPSIRGAAPCRGGRRRRAGS